MMGVPHLKFSDVDELHAVPANSSVRRTWGHDNHEKRIEKDINDTDGCALALKPT